MPTLWTLRLHHDSASPYPVSPAQLHGLACKLLETPETDHTAQAKPFTISPLFEDPTHPSLRHLRLGWLADDHPLDLSPLRGQRLRLGHHFLRVEATHREHTPYAALLMGAPTTRATFTFHSATLFKSKGRTVAIPDPGILFPGFLRRWNAHAPFPIPRDATTGLVDAIILTDHATYTIRAPLPRTGGSGRKGFLGTATFTLTSPDPTYAQVFTALCRLATMTGVGAQTTHGLGHVQVRLHPTAVTARAATGPAAALPAREVSARQR
ncbi:CRISPR system precrRNA processing endoribonuclease RAMP protein Cas6 [Streptomyces albogriseolus]|uniref:CRISPR system precrRNA processing endoribonuclease RAMP protein Cas6 n=1 Tax=Streptomyces albogriseolus TaxID=1887 RepID=UPI003CEB804D